MTAVASPPSFQPLPRWNSGDEREGLDSMSAEDVTRIFMPHKSAPRTNSASSMASSSSSSSSTSASTAPSTAPQINGDTPITTASNSEQGGWGQRKKAARKEAARGMWPNSKAEPVSGLSTARSQALPTPSSGQSAASTMNTAMHQPSPILPSQSRPQSQQNGSRTDQPSTSADSSAILALLPMTGTFERKQIVVPFFPEVLRIGRQTNAKTVPTAVNGYFDSKVLSRQHAEVWGDRNGKIWIRDVKSSNGTFVNGVRLSPENRDSEPHELREQDTLELGIDIVSEDQKSIVHHKVSAKVELAGIYPNQPSLLEMDNPNAGNAILGEPMSPQLSQMRGRGANQGPIGSNGRMSGPANLASNNPNMMGLHRQMNLWMGPVTIEQVVKKLTSELKSAKQQSHDLHRTGEFFDTLLRLQPGEEPPKSLPKAATEEKQTNGVAPPAQLDPISPFSQPPAPPPQQPLPEKPGVARFAVPVPKTPELPNQPALKRADTEKSRAALNSPTRAESGQIISLVEALKIKTHELDSKVDYIKSLEVDLAREKHRREIAEKKLSGDRLTRPDDDSNGAVEDEAFEPPLDSMEMMEYGMPNGYVADEGNEKALSRSASTSTIRNDKDSGRPNEDVSGLAARLQAQLDLRIREMNEMKILMESYRQRTEKAEEGRRSLAEMVENIRAGGDKSALPAMNDDDPTLVGSQANGSIILAKPTQPRDLDRSPSFSQLTHRQPNGSAVAGNLHSEIEKTVSHVLQQHQREWGGPGGGGRMVQSAPYVSMVGVVLIGVGIMTWLNGWQPGGDK